jgi:hypothetical protein
MKRKNILIILGALIILLLIIFYIHPRPFIPPRLEDLSNVVITMERTMCFGSCPVYVLTIYGDGRIEYEGEQYVEIIGKQTTQISEDQVRELIDEFYNVHYFSMNDEYRHKRDKWGQYYTATDLPTTITSITINDYRKKVVDYFGAPQELIDLEKKIDEVAGTEQWIGNGGRR